MLTLSQKEIIQTLITTPAEYMSKSLEQRNPGPLSAGSTFHSPQTLNSLCQIQWERYEDNWYLWHMVFHILGNTSNIILHHGRWLQRTRLLLN